MDARKVRLASQAPAASPWILEKKNYVDVMGTFNLHVARYLLQGQRVFSQSRNYLHFMDP
jgi:hypothetical protein